jgi:tRNA(fMet)-specific endonuclease VapC
LVCVDTNFLIDLAKKDKAARAKMDEMLRNNESVYTTTISLAEYFAGAYGSKDKAAIEHARRFLGSFARITLDDRSAMQYGELYNSFRSSTIGDRDLFIASIALANGQTLITRNVKHFESVPGLKIESW